MAVCAVREAYAHASSISGHASSHLPIGNALQSHQKANECLEKAAFIVRGETSGVSSIYETVSETKESVLSNLNKLKLWQENGGNFEGAIMW